MPAKVIGLGRPLYGSDGRHAGPPQCDPKAHAGLWYDKFCNAWQAPQRDGWANCKLDAESKLSWIKTVTGRPVGDGSLLSEYAERRRQMVAALGGKCLDLVTQSRFVTGLGREHPVKNGFAWHATLGTPYLPGSSVKGIVRTWASQDASCKGELVLGKLEQAGCVILLDALPLKQVCLEADVMTPHYADYYEECEPPGDWMSPTPIPFLVVAPGARFQFGLLPRTPSDVSYLPTVEGWLREALEWLGAGAKTAVGYGRFVPAAGLALDHIGEGRRLPETPARPVPANRPRYQAGVQVTVKCVQDPKGKGRPWFEADDGFGGTLIGAKPDEVPSIAMGQAITLEIAATLMEGYNFRLPREKKGGVRTQTPW